MEQFKELHKTVEQLRTSGLSTGEIKKVSKCSFQLEGATELRPEKPGQMCFVHQLLFTLPYPLYVPPVLFREGLGVGAHCNLQYA